MTFLPFLQKTVVDLLLKLAEVEQACSGTPLCMLVADKDFDKAGLTKCLSVHNDKKIQNEV